MMIERIDGEEAVRAFTDRYGLPTRAYSSGFLREFAKAFANLPYENISKIIKYLRLGDPYLSLRLPHEVVNDHIRYGFGGTCFSLTFLFERVLRSYGFKCYKVMADMRSGRNVHCLVIVEEPGAKYLVDPGYALYEVVELPRRGSCSVVCPHAIVEVGTVDGVRYDVWTIDPAGRKWRYSFKDIPVDDTDFEGFWIESFSKPTLNNICLTKMTPSGHLYFRKDFFKFTGHSGITKGYLKVGVERFVSAEFGIDPQWVDYALTLLAKRQR